MQFVDLEAQYARLKPGIDARIAKVLAHGGYILGPEVGEFERALADYVGVSHAVGCANGTDALVLALRALGIGPGDCVITTPFTFFATAEAIALVGATPAFADIDARTFNLDAAALDAAIPAAKARGLIPRAAIAVDLFGQPADYPAIETVTHAHGLKLIADAAQGMGGMLAGRRAGAFGDIATTSFFPAKPLGCYGDGGAVLTDDDALAASVRSLRVHGKGVDKYDNVRIGLNSRLDTIQAAVLLEKLAAFPDELVRREEAAQRYVAALPNALAAPLVPQGYSSSWAQFSVLAESGAERDRYVAALAARGIPAMIYYRKPLHLQPAFADLGHAPGDFPRSEHVSERIFSLPMSPDLAREDQDRVLDALHGI